MPIPFKRKRIYADSGSFTPVDKEAYRVIKKILKKQTDCTIANPIAPHKPGREAQAYLEEARQTVARIYQTKKENIVFTSGATEANLIAMRTAILRARRQGIEIADMHGIIGFEEHSSVHADAEYLKTLGMQCTIVKPEKGNRFTPKDIVKQIQKNTILFSLQYVNSRHGTIQPIAKIAEACRNVQPMITVHTDAAQATAYYNCSPQTLQADMVTIDGTKSFGPQGTGALLFRKIAGYPGLKGECTENDIRPGTPAVALLCGFASALKKAKHRREKNVEQVYEAREYLAERLKEVLPDTYIHGINKPLRDIGKTDWKTIAPHLLYCTFPNTNHAYLATLMDNQGYAVTTGSACEEEEDDALRISVLPNTKYRDIRALVKCIQKHLTLAKNP